MRARTLFASLFALGLVLTSLPAYAQGGAYVWGPKRIVNFRTTVAGVNYVRDSTWANRGTGIANTVLDTTAAISSDELYTNPSQQSADTDTIPLFEIALTPKSAEESATDPVADSVYFGIQASLDGQNWVVLLPTSPHVVSGVTPNAIIALEEGTTNCFARIFKQHISATKGYEAATSLPEGEFNLHGWGYYRFIFGGDHVGEWVCRLWGWKPVTPGGN